MNTNKLKIREATALDFDALYSIGESTSEFQVSATQRFMDRDEFRRCLTNPIGVFLVAEVTECIAGFIYINAKDARKKLQKRYAALVYIVVLPEFRHRGIARRLYRAALEKVKRFGITHLYAWAHAEGDDAVIKLLEREGFARGHRFIWMDRKI